MSMFRITNFNIAQHGMDIDIESRDSLTELSDLCDLFNKINEVVKAHGKKQNSTDFDATTVLSDLPSPPSLL